MANPLCENNAGMSTNTLNNSPSTPNDQFPGLDLHINGIFDAILYLGTCCLRVFRAG